MIRAEVYKATLPSVIHWPRRSALPALLAGVYLLATLFTNAHFMGDTVDYVTSVLTFVEFLEFGHMMWRPVGWLSYQVTGPLAHLVTGPDPRLAVTLTLVWVNWLAGLVSVLLLYGFINRVCKGSSYAALASAAFIFSQGFLNFAQTGSSYIPGLALLLAGLYTLAKGAEASASPRASAVWAGLALAGAVLLWTPYVWALPAAVISPLVLFGNDPRRRRLVFETILSGALFGTVAFTAAVFSLKLYSIGEITEWIVKTSSGGSGTSGWPRMVFGFGRSFIHLGNDGILFKRFLVGDPLNPAPFVHLFCFSLWKLCFFYLFAGSIIALLFRAARGRPALLFLALSSLPVLVFALLFDGGAVERYLPLYPALFLALAVAVSLERQNRWLKVTALAFIIVAAFTNTSAMATAALDRQQDAVAARFEHLQPLLKPESLIVIASQSDELSNLKRSHPFHPINRAGDLRIVPVAVLGTSWLPAWREDFAAGAFEAWAEGGDVWVSTRVLSERPRPEWNWVEGADPRISWTEIFDLFSRLERGHSVGGEDGFALLAPSGHNRQLLESVTRR